ncbi:amino acid adenylation domain-containing protein [Tumebacillus sp. DT12]|uniref:Amino acid adenylation domain-containing protein n=1 Tax=Tumebacillus lacus TaxID=2995335 RepID=A0ABT3WZQ7_9BACL|nr:non-ribosomal peptide synthetase [Tumebacillus lacus]MCX7568806.1 amino acid adenylation domain-containing protein [Tumebacillus lacus]
MFVPSTASRTLLELLRERAFEQPDRRAYTCWSEEEERHLTYADVDRRARAIAALLQQRAMPGERALLLYPPGIDYLVAFFGCLYAGVLAVPAYPPRLNGNLDRLLAVVDDCEATLALTTAEIRTGIERRFADAAGLARLQWVATEAMDEAQEEALAAAWQAPEVEEETLAFLQYTSGSTGTPKGVMLSHGNLIDNLGLIERAFGTSADSEGVIWLPPYHDMGLIGGILQPLFTGYPMTLMAPVDFITKPLRWLQAISRTGATVSGGPNFAYDLCVQKISPDQMAGLDLSRWDTAFTGAEPIRAQTLERFAAHFASCGFRKEAFYPCYGLAEGTLFVTGGRKGQAPAERTFDETALAEGRAVAQDGGRTLVSSGRVGSHSQLVEIIDPASGRQAATGQVGEIWAMSPSVAKGYWQREGLTEETFRAFRTDNGAGPYLRTGDLGFLLDGELYVTGRLKDLIIIRGRNHYPQDIEYTVQQSHPALRPDTGAAVAVEEGGEERLVIVQEVERAYRKGNLAEVAEAIRRAVSERHELQVHAVVLIKPASIPKTSSGKIQRHACRDRFLDGSLDELHRDMVGGATSVEEEGGASQSLHQADVLLERTAQILKVPSAQIQFDTPLQAYGLDSLMAVELKNEVEAQFGVDIPFAQLLDGLSLADLARVIADSGTTAGVERVERPSSCETTGDAPLSYGQRSLWFLQRVAPDSAAYHIARAARWSGELEVEALRASFDILVKRHAALRTSFPLIDGEPVQRLHEPGALDFTVEDAAPWSEEQLRARLLEESHRPFDLEKGPLLRLRVYRRAAGEHLLLLTVHHIIADFWSLGLLVQELQTIYPAVRDERPYELPRTTTTTLDHARAQEALLSGPLGDRLWSYWQKQLSGALPVLQLPTDRPRPPIQTYRGAAESFRLDGALTERLKQLAQSQGTTLFTLLLAAYQVLLHRYTGQDDLLVGSPTVGRRAGDAHVFGYFVNPVVLRARFDRGETFSDFLARTKQTVLDALDHQDDPFARLVERLQPQRDLSYPPLLQAMFVLQRSHALDDAGLSAFALGEDEAQLAGALPLTAYRLEQRAAQFDLTLSAAESAGGLIASFEYNTDLFDSSTIERMGEQFQILVQGIAQTPDAQVADLPLLSETERHRLLHGWNDTVRDYPRDRTVHSLFAEQAARTPDATALVFGEQTLTYAALNRRANQLAHRLRRQGIEPGQFVAVSLERSLELIVGILGILKAGAVYVPVDASYPDERIEYMLADAAAPLLLTQQSLRGRFAGQRADVLCLDSDWKWIAEESETDLPCERTADSLAYVIYTSGSTGQPKGTCIPHRGIVRLVRNNPFVDFASDDVYLQFSPISFDAATFEIWGSLLNGGRLAIFPPQQLTAEELVRQLTLHRVTTIFCTTTLFNQLVEHHLDGLHTLRHLLIGGEAMSAAPVKKARQALPNCRIANAYGPTESTTFASIQTVPEPEQIGTSVPIGHPIANTQLYILDGRLQPVPVGVPGELYIGGDGLATGYLNRPELTAERFIENPFPDTPGTRLYKTGDLVRRLPDGAVDYLGRLDHQVKIRGFRIELGEIESALEAHPSLAASAVLCREDQPGDKRIVAYYVPAAGQQASGGLLRTYLKEHLPEYMIPSAFVELEALPLSPSGKVDRKALPQPAGLRDLETAYVAPKTELERGIVSVWQEVLGVDRVGLHDNFFDLGGHSMSVVTAHSKIQQVTGREFTVVEMFRHPTVAALTAYLGAEAPAKKDLGQVQDLARQKRDALNRQKQLRKDRRK